MNINTETCKTCPIKKCSGKELRQFGYKIIRCPLNKESIKEKIKQLRLDV